MFYIEGTVDVKALKLETYCNNYISECVGGRWQDNDIASVHVEI